MRRSTESLVYNMGGTIAYIGLGSNLGDRKTFIDKALHKLRETTNIAVARVSAIIETKPLGDSEQPAYLNCVAEIETELSTEQLHQQLVRIENTLGRERKEKWAPRTIDLDLLLFGDEVINSNTLIVPHPQMHLRSFVLDGLRELNPKLLHPILGETVDVLASRLNGCDYVPPTDKPQLISIAGNIGAGKTTLAKKLAAVLACAAVFERYDTNPFLPKVYAGYKDLALDSQLYFLASRVEQLSPAMFDKGRPAVTDYVFQKELIYAKLLLSDEQFELYLRIYEQLSPAVVAPAVLLYLADSPEVCLERIHRRNRPYEQQIRMSFLQAIDAGYRKLTAEWKHSPVITLTDFDCLSEKSIDRLAVQTAYYLHPPDTYESRKNN
ncbi:MAG: 2-amino-4-hydroxy-6-hydroxymethyldihydropteridine diphosphokinase [Planctomycetota bacterium]